MPRIPDFNVPSVQVQPIQMPEMQGPGVAPMPNAAPQQIQEMGQGMSRFGEGMSNIAMRMQDIVNDSVVAETDNKWRDILNQESVRFQSLQGRDAITGYNSFQENLAKQRREIETGLTNPAQKMAFRGAADRRMMDVDRQANFHVMRESYNFKVKETESRISNMFDDAISFGSRVYDPGTPLSVKLLDGSGLISDKTAAAITMGAKQDNLDAFQTRFSGLMNQAKEHLSFQGINPDDEQGKLYMKNIERGVYTGVLQRMLQGNDVDSARFFLADKNNRSKVDPKMLYDAETTLAKERKSQMSDNIARAVFMRDDLPTVEDKKNFVMGAFTAGHIDQKDLKSTFETIESLAKDEDESFKKRQNQALDLAKTKIRSATGGLGFQASESAGNALLSMDRNLYMQLGEDGVTKLEDWARTNYQERTNPAHRNQLLDMMQNKPEVFAGLTETELRYSYQLSKEDEDLFAARIKEKNGTASSADKQLSSDQNLLHMQFRKEHPTTFGMAGANLETRKDFTEWHDVIQKEWSDFKSISSNKDVTFANWLNKRDTTQVVKDGELVPLYTLPSGETGTFRVQIPNTNRTVDVLPGDIPTWERATVVEAIQNANRNPYRVYKLEQDENGVQKLVLHKRANGETAMHSSVSEAMAEAQSLGEGFTVQKGEIVSEDEQSIATHWVRNIAKPGVDVDQYVGRVRRRADLGERLKGQGATSLKDFMQRFVDNPEMRVHVPTLVEQLGISDEVSRLPEGVASPYMRPYDTIWMMQGNNVKADPAVVRSYINRETDPTRGIPQKRTDKQMADAKKFGEKLLSEGIPLDNAHLLDQFGMAEYKRATRVLFHSNLEKDFADRYQTVSGAQAFEILRQTAKTIGMEVDQTLETAMQTKFPTSYPASTSSVQSSAQLMNITSESRRAMAAEVRSASWRKGSYNWHLSNTPLDKLSSFIGPFQTENGYSPNSPVVDRAPPSPIGASLIRELQLEKTAALLNEGSMPTQEGEASKLKELDRLIELVYQGEYQEAEQWRSRNDTIDKSFKSVIPNGLPK